jgi:hypothetical protein
MVAGGYTIYTSRFAQGDIVDDDALDMMDLEASQCDCFL